MFRAGFRDSLLLGIQDQTGGVRPGLPEVVEIGPPVALFEGHRCDVQIHAHLDHLRFRVEPHFFSHLDYRQHVPFRPMVALVPSDGRKGDVLEVNPAF